MSTQQGQHSNMVKYGEYGQHGQMKYKFEIDKMDKRNSKSIIASQTNRKKSKKPKPRKLLITEAKSIHKQP